MSAGSRDREGNALSKRARRYAATAAAAAQVGAGALAASLSGSSASAIVLRAALGGLKGPLMKAGQLVAAIPDLLPPEHAAALATLQADAPSMGGAFVRRRMAAELGPDWRDAFVSFDAHAAAAASLGQVHKAIGKDGCALACKLQYPDMTSVVEADVRQLKLLFAFLGRFDGAVDARGAAEEIAARLREELDYKREARSMALYGKMLENMQDVHVPKPVAALSTKRLLTMTWLDGEKLTEETIKTRSQTERNVFAQTLFRAWYKPFYAYGVLHGDPHPGNYAWRQDGGLNLLDFGCIRVFEPKIVQAVVMVYDSLREGRDEAMVEAFRLWGFKKPSKALVEALAHWARFIYAPFLRSGVHGLEDTNATAHGRAAAGHVRAALKALGGGVPIPPEFVLLDRASIGLGGLFLRLGARADWQSLFHEAVGAFTVEALKERQAKQNVGALWG